MRRRLFILAVTLAATLGFSADALADGVVFLGATTPSPGSKVTLGGGLTFCHRIDWVCGQLEYGATAGSQAGEGAITIGIVLRRPEPGPVRWYVVGGIGGFGETSSGEVGVKYLGFGTTIGPEDAPIYLRVDYRVLLPGAAPDAAKGVVVPALLQRATVGLGFKF